MTAPEPTVPHSPAAGADDLAGVLEAYLAELQAGRAPDRAAVLAAHPHLAVQLDSCLAALEFIHHTAADGVPACLGDFRVVREVGRGGMGVVYEAEQISLRRRVALKVLRYGGPADPEALARFRREAELVARLHHTNIVPVFAFGCENGVHYYAMQLIDGHSLAGAAAPRDPLEVARWGLQAAEALAYAHARGIVHRDVKPSNLLLDGEGIVWLTDFGLARPAEETALTAAGVPLGTPRYMSPEQIAAAQPVDSRTDVYSLGATLYELATGRPAFDADGVAQLLARIRDEEPTPPRRLRPDLPRDLETVILKCLHKEPQRRYETALALADDLRAFGEGRAIRARRPSLAERARRWLAVRRFNAGAVAALMALAALAVVWAVVFVRGGGWRGTAQVSFGLNPPVASAGGRPLAFDAPVTAEVLADDADELLVPPFALPTADADVHLPRGRHRLRLSYPGGLSACYRLDLERTAAAGWTVTAFDAAGGRLPSGANPFALPVHDRWADPPDRVAVWATLPAGRGHDVIVLGPTSVRRLAGGDGKPLWRTPLDGNDERTGRLLAWDRRRPRLAVLGDRLVWASARSMSLVGMSAVTGEVLWEQMLPQTDRGGGEVGQPLVTAVGEDAQPGVVAVVRKDWVPPAWELWAVSAEGRLVWSAPLPPAVSNEPRHAFEERPPLARATVGGRAVVVCLVAGCLVGIDPRTGKPAWPVRPLGFPPAMPPRFADVDGDRSTDALLVRVAGPGQLALVAIDLATGRHLWERVVPGLPERGETDWPLVVTLDGGTRPEVIVRQARFDAEPPSTTVEHVGVASLDGRTGQRLWAARLGRSVVHRGGPAGGVRVESAASVRFAVGPDVDGDGVRDLFVSSVVALDAGRRAAPALFTDAVSGRDGRRLWWRRHPLPTTRFGSWWSWSGVVRKPVWWAVNGKEPPLLVVSARSDGRGVHGAVGADSFVLQANTGRPLHVIPSLDSPQAFDLDGDGRAELIGGNVAQGRAGTAGLQAICGTAPAVSARVAGRDGIDAARDDPRRLVPLPWARHEVFEDGKLWSELLSHILLVLFPAVLLLLLVGSAAHAVTRRYFPQAAAAVDASVAADTAEPPLRARGRVLLIAAGAPVALLAGAVWVWLARPELEPGEAYNWHGWWAHWLRAGCLVGFGLLIAGELVAIAVRTARKWRRGP